MPNEILTKAEIDTAIKQLEGWTARINAGQLALEKAYVFSGFNAAGGVTSLDQKLAQKSDAIAKDSGHIIDRPNMI